MSTAEKGVFYTKYLFFFRQIKQQDRASEILVYAAFFSGRCTHRVFLLFICGDRRHNIGFAKFDGPKI